MLPIPNIPFDYSITEHPYYLLFRNPTQYGLNPLQTFPCDKGTCLIFPILPFYCITKTKEYKNEIVSPFKEVL
jgi:hypothetical protein